jgi:hypothetical protein
MFAVENVVIPWKYVSQQTIGTMHFGSLSRPLVPAQVVLSIEFRVIESCLVLLRMRHGKHKTPESALDPHAHLAARERQLYVYVHTM